MKRTSGRIGVGLVLVSTLVGACFTEREDSIRSGPEAASAEVAATQAGDAREVILAMRSHLERSFGKTMMSRLASPAVDALSSFDFASGQAKHGAELLSPLGASAAAVANEAKVELPTLANGLFQIKDARSGLSVHVGLVGASSSAREDVNGFSVYRSAYANDAHIVHRVTPKGTEDYVYFPKTLPTSHELRYDLQLGDGVAGLRFLSQTIEMLDAKGAPRLRMAPPYAVDGDGRRLDLAVAIEGCAYDTSGAMPWDRPTVDPGAKHCTIRLSWSGDAKAPLVVDPMWSTTTDMKQQRFNATIAAIPLAAGSFGKRAIVVGGDLGDGVTATNTTEYFDENTNSWGSGPQMAAARTEHAMVQMPVAGGQGFALWAIGGRSGSTFLKDAEKITVSSNGMIPQNGSSWVAVSGSMIVARAGHTATVLGDKLLVAGGFNSTGALNSTELATPDSWGLAGANPPPLALNMPRMGHVAVQIGPNKVLLMGGQTGTAPATVTGSIERCEFPIPPAPPFCTELFADNTPYTPMKYPRAKFGVITDQAAAMPPTKIYVIGGAGVKNLELCPIGPVAATPCIEKPAMMANARTNFTITSVSSPGLPPDASKYIIVGGLDDNGTALEKTEYFEPATLTFTDGPKLTVPRAKHVAAALGGVKADAAGTPTMQRVVVAGGDVAGKTAETLHCANDSECNDSTLYCSKDGFCLKQKTQGETCNPMKECASADCKICGEHPCVDGYCCDSDCKGQCSVCNSTEFGTPGTCVAVSGKPRNGRAACPVGMGADDVACAGYCDGVTPDKCTVPAGKTCKPSVCMDDMAMVSPSTLTTYVCSDIGTCEEVVDTCGGATCSGSSCRPKCTDDKECLKGYSCVNGQCNALAPICGKNKDGVENGAVVSAADPTKILQECAPYHCVDGACSNVCDTAYDCIPSTDPKITIICNDSRACVDLKQEQTGESTVSCSATPADESSRFGWLAALAIAGAFASRRRRA